MKGERCDVCGYIATDSMARHQQETGHRGSTPGTIRRVGWEGRWEFHESR